MLLMKCAVAAANSWFSTERGYSW